MLSYWNVNIVSHFQPNAELLKCEYSVTFQAKCLADWKVLEVHGFQHCIKAPIVYRLKSVGALEMKLVAPIPEQIATTTMHFLKVPAELC